MLLTMKWKQNITWSMAPIGNTLHYLNSVQWEIFKYNVLADNNYLPEIFHYAVVNTHGSLVDPQKLSFDKR